MSTYYGYAEREAEDNIDWSVVGSDITKMLQEEVTRRDTLKKELDDASREFGKVLSEAPTGTHRGANNFITGYAGDASQARLMQDRLLKSGNLKVKDYLLQRANLTDGTEGIFNVSKNFQAEFKRKADRMTKEESAKLEQTLFSLTEGFSNFNNSGAYINPTDFTVSIAKKERVKGKNGEYVYQMSKNPQDFFTVNELNTFVSTDLERFDTEKALDDIAAAAGARDQQITYYDKATDRFITQAISDISGDVYNKNLDKGQKKLVDGYIDAEKDAINEILANPYTAASILTDYIGKGYDFTFDPKEAKKDEKMILLEKDPGGSGLPRVAVSGPQDIVLRETLSRGIKYRLDQKYAEVGVEKKRFPPPTRDKSGDRSQAEAQSDMDHYSVWIKQLLEGDADQKNSALNKLANKNPDNIETMEFVINPDGTSDVQVLNVDGSRSTVIADWENATNREIADAFLNNKLFPTLSAKTLERYESVIKGTGVLGATKVAPYDYLTGTTLYDHTTSTDKYVRSTRKIYTPMPEADMVIAAKGGVKAKPSVVYRSQFTTGKIDEAFGGGSVDSFISAIDLSYLGNFAGTTNAKRNPFKRVIKGMKKVKFSTLPDIVMGREWDNVMFNIDPKYGASFSLPMSEEVQEKIPEIMKLLEGAIIPDKYGNVTKFTREDIYKVIGGDPATETKGYNDALLISSPSLYGGAATQAPFRAYDPNVDDGVIDYNAKKAEYEKKK